MIIKTVNSLFKLNEYGGSTGTRGHPFKLCKKTVIASQYALLFYFCFLFFTNAKCNRVKHLAKSKTVSSNVLLSDICHIQSPHAFKTVLKTHLYHKFIQILSADLPPPPPPPPHLLSLTLYIPSVWGMWGDNMRNTF